MKIVNKFKDKKVLVLGLAKSGTEAAKLLNHLGALVTVNDRKPYEENEQAKELKKEGVEVVCGSHPEELVSEELDYLVKNPGVRYDHPLVAKAEGLNIPVYTEVELAYLISEAEIIGITGSNGKTTTTTYVGEMLKGGQRNPLIAGNIGKVACKVAREATSKDEMVVELSSFQLMGTETFAPKIAVLLNFVEAHLDYHGSMDDYIEAKSHIFRNQTSGDYLIYNADDPLVSKVVKGAKAQLIPFSVEKNLENGACLSEGWLTFFNEKLIQAKDMSLPGDHNVANALAAAAAAILGGADIEQIRHVLKTFEGVEHRLQFIGDLEGRKVYNNSKATNVPATITALKAFNQPVVLIAGGLDRGLSFDALKPLLSEKVSALITYGETKDKLAETGRQSGVPFVDSVDTLNEATVKAYSRSNKGDVILLSPACASWDQFKTFEERGKAFTEQVELIKQQK